MARLSVSDVLLQLDQESDEDFDGYVEPSDVDYEGDSAFARNLYTCTFSSTISNETRSTCTSEATNSVHTGGIICTDISSHVTTFIDV